jgi:hypothetical protein
MGSAIRETTIAPSIKIRRLKAVKSSIMFLSKEEAGVIT